jgi:hypothetical protein
MRQFVVRPKLRQLRGGEFNGDRRGRTPQARTQAVVNRCGRLPSCAFVLARTKTAAPGRLRMFRPYRGCRILQ